MAFLPNCNFQEVSLAPCMAGGGGNISGACCSSLNGALDAGHRCVCSLLLSNPVFASLVTNLLTLPLMLPLPGCFLFAPSLAACQATTIQQQTNAPPTATPAIATTGGAAAAGMTDLPTTPAATITPPPEKKSAGPEKDGRAAGNGTSEAAPRAGQSVSRSDACRRHPGNAGQGTAYALTFLTAVAVFWINCITVSW
ncbi:hypothetical protein QOZ80_6AG0531000 [Eleusine coracana subsp. coracana]|nr:hypothetical protein QOZ80_6AG0531000 [Eleusine coracana subsp. coracana]